MEFRISDCELGIEIADCGRPKNGRENFGFRIANWELKLRNAGGQRTAVRISNCEMEFRISDCELGIEIADCGRPRNGGENFELRICAE
jgi:hypothetical protein